MYLLSSTKYFVMYLGKAHFWSSSTKYKQLLQKMYLSTGKYKYRCTWPQPWGLHYKMQLESIKAHK